jgi:HTH-type transcriptional regulator / antitoxin HigA
MIKSKPLPRLATSYIKLTKRWPLRSIRSEAELDQAQQRVDHLLTRKLDASGQSYLETLSDLILVYEQTHHPVPTLPPAELLMQLLSERQLTQAQLVRATGIAKATVSDLVAGKRPFTVEHMQRIASVFHLTPTVFFPKAND